MTDAREDARIIVMPTPQIWYVNQRTIGLRSPHLNALSRPAIMKYLKDADEFLQQAGPPIPALNQGHGYKHVPDLSAGISNLQLNTVLAGTANLHPSRYPVTVTAVDVATADDDAWLRLARLHCNSDVRDTRAFLLAMRSVPNPWPINPVNLNNYNMAFSDLASFLPSRHYPAKKVIANQYLDQMRAQTLVASIKIKRDSANT